MRALVQRVGEARVRIDDTVVGAIGRGLCVLVGVTHDDDDAAASKLADKVWNLRVFPDDAGVMNVPLAEAGGEALVVSQFTLYGDTRRGRRPSWVAAAPPERAGPLVESFVAALRNARCHRRHRPLRRRHAARARERRPGHAHARGVSLELVTFVKLVTRTRVRCAGTMTGWPTRTSCSRD